MGTKKKEPVPLSSFGRTKAHPEERRLPVDRRSNLSTSNLKSIIGRPVALYKAPEQPARDREWVGGVIARREVKSLADQLKEDREKEAAKRAKMWAECERRSPGKAK
jgi:hypothetical protein